MSSIRARTLERLVREYNHALDELRYELHRSRVYQIEAKRRVDAAWSALYAVAGRRWCKELKARRLTG